MCILMTELGRPEVTPCSEHDVKVQSVTSHNAVWSLSIHIVVL